MEKRAMCFVCRISFNTAQPNGVFFGNEISRFRKQECAETISSLLLGSTSHPLNIYFQSAAYCIRCTKIILDVNFTWKQLTALENRINHNLKVLRILFRKNFEGIPNKIDMDVPDVDPENLQEWETFTYDQVIQICMKVMHVEDDADSVLNPDQVHFLDPNDFLKTHFEEVNDEDDYFYLNSFEGQVKENELVGNIVGSSDRIQVYAKEDDTDSSFEVSSDTSDSSSYCSSNSGGRRKRKLRRKPLLQNNVNVNVGTGLLIPTNVPLQGNNDLTSHSAKVGLPNLHIVGAVGTSRSSIIQKPLGAVPIPIASINQVVSSEFLKKFPIPVDKNKFVTETKPIMSVGNNTNPILSKPAASVSSQLPPSTLSSSIKPVVVTCHDKETPLKTIIVTNEPKAPQISVKSVSNATVIPVINFKPKVVIEEAVENKATKPAVESVQPPSNVKVSVGSITNVIPNTNRHSSISHRPKQPQMNVNFQKNNSRFPMRGRPRPGPSSFTKGPFKNTASKRNHTLVGRSSKSKNDTKKHTGREHDSDSSSKSVLSCSSFSDSISSDFDSSSDDNTLYPSASLTKLQKHKKRSGNCSSSSSIVILSD